MEMLCHKTDVSRDVVMLQINNRPPTTFRNSDADEWVAECISSVNGYTASYCYFWARQYKACGLKY